VTRGTPDEGATLERRRSPNTPNAPAVSRRRSRSLARPSRGLVLTLLFVLFWGTIPGPMQSGLAFAETGSVEAVVSRGPYVQKTTTGSTLIRWRTDSATTSRVLYGATWGDLENSGAVEEDVVATVEHEIEISGLAVGTRYYYAIGTLTEILAGDDADHYFETHPEPGLPKNTRVWILGDSGYPGTGQRAVRDSYYAFTGDRHTDLWLHVGDVSQSTGTDAQYQEEFFDVYQRVLRTTSFWPTIGNHDRVNSNSNALTGPYYENFSLPDSGEAGGLSSGTEAYFSFDYANIHLVSLNSEDVDRTFGGDMLTWLALDLAATDKDWIIVYFHHSPYSEGHHNSDDPLDSGGRSWDMRGNALPILDDYGVDLVFTGHSHSYERSILVDGHYGTSDTLTESMKIDPGDGREGGDGPYVKPLRGPVPYTGPGEGAVYTVAGSGSVAWGGPLDHPVMVSSLNILGSVVLEIEGRRLDAKFLDSTCADSLCSVSIQDQFTMYKGGVCLEGEDADSDAICDDVDNCVDDFNPEQEDADSDAAGDACDPCPNDPDDDFDQDGVCGDVDNCPDDVNPAQQDTDDDGLGNACDDCPLDPDNDTDQDAVCGEVDNCPEDPNADQADSDEDGAGDVCDVCPFDATDDVDLDDVCGLSDNCPDVPNSGQGDVDGDGAGDACDPCPADLGDDSDSDGRCSDSDNCPGVYNPDQTDSDSDGAGDPCDVCPLDPDNDFDGDGRCGNVDNCPGEHNPGQQDSDDDGIGNPCDSPDDSDGDSVSDAQDNCPSILNPAQQDWDGDGLGDTGLGRRRPGR